MKPEKISEQSECTNSVSDYRIALDDFILRLYVNHHASKSELERKVIEETLIELQQCLFKKGISRYG